MSTLVDQHFATYPQEVFVQLGRLRTLIMYIAKERNLGEVKQSLKWGEPSFSVKDGSPIRMDWKDSTPEYCYLFFHCQTKLVDTFRELYPEILVCRGNRAIELSVSGQFPEDVIKHCLELAMTYKKRKNLPLLGA